MANPIVVPLLQINFFNESLTAVANWHCACQSFGGCYLAVVTLIDDTHGSRRWAYDALSLDP